MTFIAQPTGSTSAGPYEGKPCVIPWYQMSNVNYFCSATFQCYPNQPDNNATAYCQRGRFLWGRVNSAGDPYFGQLTLSQIDLGETGMYEVVYWVAFSCEDTGFATTGDSIKLIINPESENRLEDVTDVNNIGFLKRWIRKSFKFAAYNPKIDVRVFSYQQPFYAYIASYCLFLFR